MGSVTLPRDLPDLPLRPGFVPRKWQLEALFAVRPAWVAGQSPVINVCTGAGKGDFIAALLVRAAALEHWRARQKGLQARPAVVIVHRQELVRDLHARAEVVGVTHGVEVGIIMGTRCDATAPALVCSVASMSAERLAHLAAGACILLIDEAHHATADSYGAVLADLKSKAKLGGRSMPILGLTATAFRHDDAGLGRVFDCVAYEYTMQSAIADGVLAQPVFVTPKLTGVGGLSEAENKDQRSPARISAAVQEWLARAVGRQTIAFCTNISHAGLLAAAFRAAGVEAEAVAGSNPKPEIARKLAEYRAGKIRVLCSVALVLEGFDAPATSSLLVCRAMKSPIDKRQALGRGLRSAPDKVDCVCIDMTGGAMGDWGLDKEAELAESEGTAADSKAAKPLVLEVGARVRLRAEPEWAAGVVDGDPDRGRWPIRWPRGDGAGPRAGMRTSHKATELSLVSAEDDGLAAVRIERRGDAQVTLLYGAGGASIWPWYCEGMGDAACWSTGGRLTGGHDVTALCAPLSGGSWVLWRIERAGDQVRAARVDEYARRIEAMRAGEGVLGRAGATPRAAGDWATEPTGVATAAALRKLGADVPAAQGVGSMLLRGLMARAARAEAMKANNKSHAIAAKSAVHAGRRAELAAVSARLGLVPAASLTVAGVEGLLRELRVAWAGYLRAGTDTAATAEWGRRLMQLGVARAEIDRAIGGAGQAVRDAGQILGVQA